MNFKYFYSPGDAQDSSKFSAKGVGAKFSIFDVLHAGPQVAASFISTGYENVTPGPVEGPANKVQELEWDKAARGELEEKAEPDQIIPGPSEENQEEEPDENLPYQRPPMDLFKSIFADSESEEEEVVEIKKEPEEKPVRSDAQRNEKQKSPAVEEMDEDTYGPRLPVSGNTAIKVTSVSLVGNQDTNVNQDEWVESDKVGKKKKDKKNKKSKKKKDKKDKKSKKRKRRHSDVSSSSTDDEVDDAKILKKIAALKKLQKL